ncbi:transglycosylase SLT domain-containing protein [Mycobacterium koreense]|uniref:Peptidase n=1 Tax=Mycolicibacillus koreensis TaxID=1069220 RepID=A0A7I7SCG6_9MYCO|nr:transglycosylase SLT domain-containing protein [Mycolicibacillus koreensis]MCV7247696.1 transglycosylase SLT domain-containing protein [Mycolicibacillus koreensis]OSC34768.1 peptidase [Mycolicibacillus koreensis]BBY54081.1 hypothetical protein MKOR_13320 [Mycolicibacillus koreensis]
MTIDANFEPLDDGVDKANNALPPGTRPQGPANVDPRVADATGQTNEESEKHRKEVKERTEKTGKFSRGLNDIDQQGKKSVAGVDSKGPASNRGAMPQMPPMPQQPAPAPSPSPAPAPSFNPPSVPAPSGLTNIDPALLQQLVELSNQQAAADAADGVTPGVDDPFSDGAARSPQNPQPIDVSQVALDKFGRPLSEAETAAVIDQALTINGVPDDPALRAQWHELYMHMAQNESSLNPDAVNLSDSNATGPTASDGAPSNSSRGIWQCIPSTFAAYHMGGTSTSIYDPVASAAASMNYVMHTYHISPDGAGLASFSARQGVGTGSYQGY